MKLIVRVGLPLVILFAAATTAVAVAAPVPPTTPFPNPEPDPAVCLDEKAKIDRQVINHRFAKAEYDRAKQADNGGAAAKAAVRAKERLLHLVAIELNNAKYAEAKCRNQEGLGGNKACTALALEYNRLIDEAAIKVELEKLAEADHAAAIAERNQGIGDAETFDRTLRDWDLAKLEVTTANRHVAEARKKITDNRACQGFPFERPGAVPPRPIPPQGPPQPAPPPREVPPPAPAPTSAPAPTDVPMSIVVSSTAAQH